MLIKQKLSDFLFLDIETVSQYSNYDELVKNNPRLGELFIKRAKKFDNEYSSDIRESDYKLASAVYLDKAGLFPEFGKILAIGLGMVIPNKDGGEKDYIKVFNNHDEIVVLNEFISAINKMGNFVLNGHNIITFDIPYICKRMVYNNIQIPDKINFADKKPWEVNVVDTINLMKFGGYDMISLDLLCHSCNIESPKNSEISGLSVNNIYYGKDKDDGLKKIVEYNNRDIKACIDLSKYLIKL